MNNSSSATPLSSGSRIPRSATETIRFALVRLKDQAVPFRLGLLSFLRLTASLALEEVPGPDLAGLPARPFLPRYSEILSTLAAHDPHWWNRCSLDAEGFPISEDSWMEAQLRPFNDFLRSALAEPLRRDAAAFQAMEPQTSRAATHQTPSMTDQRLRLREAAFLLQSVVGDSEVSLPGVVQERWA
jgi:hypothetical protein